MVETSEEDLEATIEAALLGSFATPRKAEPMEIGESRPLYETATMTVGLRMAQHILFCFSSDRAT